MHYLITGTAGFIGFHTARQLLTAGHVVTGYDAVTNYYDPQLKRARLAHLARYRGFRPVEARVEDLPTLLRTARGARPDVIIHLAAQAGVRYSLEHPDEYISTNVVGTFNVLEVARQVRPQHLLIASTSSVYGGNTVLPFRETDRADCPVSLYAATKKSGEAMAHSYAHLWNVPTTCFRFFTVYGPWGRPDMALFKFVDAIRNGEAIDVYGGGRMRRDFTYVDDLVTAIVALCGVRPVTGSPVSEDDSLSPVAPFRTVNIGGGKPVGLMKFIEAVDDATGTVSAKNFLPLQAGDMTATFADTRLLEALIGDTPSTPIEVGVAQFVAWYDAYTRSTAAARMTAARGSALAG